VLNALLQRASRATTNIAPAVPTSQRANHTNIMRVPPIIPVPEADAEGGAPRIISDPEAERGVAGSADLRVANPADHEVEPPVHMAAAAAHTTKTVVPSLVLRSYGSSNLSAWR
jgi:hypothetical protein